MFTHLTGAGLSACRAVLPKPLCLSLASKAVANKAQSCQLPAAVGETRRQAVENGEAEAGQEHHNCCPNIQ